MPIGRCEVTELFEEHAALLRLGVDAPVRWTFRLFHPSLDVLKAACAELVSQHCFEFLSVKWNRDPHYRVSGWMGRVSVLRAFSPDGFHRYHWALCDWLADGVDAPLAGYIEGAARRGSLEPPTFREVKTLGDVAAAWPEAPPKRPRPATDWEVAWDRDIADERRKRADRQSHVLTDALDAFRFGADGEGARSPWLPLCPFELRGRRVFVTSLQLGPVEDGVSVALAPAFYLVELQLGHVPSGRVNAAMRLRPEGCEPRRGAVLGQVTTDVATLGFYDQTRLRACFQHDAERLFEWGEAAMAEATPDQSGVEHAELLPRTFGDLPYGALVYDRKRGLVLPYATSGDGDGTYAVYELLNPDDGQRIGFEVEFTRVAD
ncbi:MAG TPA: hypothetical protein VLI06_21885 [Solimonas sp.]|nr:hypothetical protein [Solimonas sp.]